METGPANYEQETINPEHPEGLKIKVIIPHLVYLRAYKHDPVKYENLRGAKEVLENPKRIFWGIREHNDGGWCYTGIPKKLYIKQSNAVDFPDGKVFAVYINPGLQVFDWTVEYADENDTMCPKDWKERYKSLIWKNIS
ncbi:MAG: hypothetical protein K8R02_02930 [Anaerohalosphaeraceae bacterium]|nr:hypothetical protein [Anaerohalosphaeraceae bacterium]